MLLLSTLLLLPSLSGWAFSQIRIPTQQRRHRKVSLRQSADTPFVHVPQKYHAAARLLEERSVKFAPYKRSKTCPRPFAEVWESFRELLRNSRNPDCGLPSAEEVLTELKASMVASYSDETKFEKALFASLRKCLTAFEIPQSEHDTIVLNLGNTQEYAVGIAMQKYPEGGRLQDRILLRSHHTRSELDAKSIPGHAACLCHKERTKWSVTDCLSVVKLETSDSTCEGFDLFRDGEIWPPDLAGRHAALGQTILLNLGCVLYQAKRGVLGDHIPLAVIAATKEGGLKGKARKRALRWVAGKLEIPKACGWGFEYSIQNYGHFSKKHDDESVDHAVSLYLETLLHGLIAAVNVQKKLATGEIPLSVPASGQALMVGNVTLNHQVHLCASPIPGALTWQDCTTKNSWNVSQGELFKGRLDISELLQNPDVVSVDFHVPAGLIDVLLKVSSATVHRLLIKPGDAYIALQMIKLFGSKELVDEIGSVLYAVADGDPGFVTLMRDLTEEGYEDLKPCDSSSEIDVLWDGFQDLVVRVLLPIAAANVVHADIRPGYDVTSNILCKVESGIGGVKKATMKLIDFESLVSYSMWTTAFLDDRYIKGEHGWDATTYVWWQCMAVAYTWKEHLNGNRLRTDGSLVDMKRSLLNGSRGPAWLRKYRDRAKGKITVDVVKATLQDLAEEFTTNRKELFQQLTSASCRRHC